MDNYIMLEGKKIPLTDEQVEMMLRIKTSKQNPFKELKHGEKYYFIDSAGHVIGNTESYRDTDIRLYAIANYCADKEMMNQRAMHETLNRLLWRFSMENGEGANSWNNKNNHWNIIRNCQNVIVASAACAYSTMGSVYFPSQELAQQAIDEIVKPFMKNHPNFVW